MTHRVSCKGKGFAYAQSAASAIVSVSKQYQTGLESVDGKCLTAAVNYFISLDGNCVEKDMAIRCKRIIDGKTYNTETATQIAGWDEENAGPYDSGTYLFQTRFGAFFEYYYLDGAGEDDYEKIRPLSPDEAQRWLEDRVSWDPALIERLFGEMPEAGSAEVKYTLRLPESLRNQLAKLAETNNQSLNAWIVRCLERCAKFGDQNG